MSLNLLTKHLIDINKGNIGLNTWFIGSDYINYVAENIIQTAFQQRDVTTPLAFSFLIPTAGFSLLTTPFNIMFLEPNALNYNFLAQFGYNFLTLNHILYHSDFFIRMQKTNIDIFYSRGFTTSWNNYTDSLWSDYTKMNQDQPLVSSKTLEMLIRQPKTEYVPIIKIQNEHNFIYQTYLSDMNWVNNFIYLTKTIPTLNWMTGLFLGPATLMFGSYSNAIDSLFNKTNKATFYDNRVTAALYNANGQSYTRILTMLQESNDSFNNPDFIKGLQTIKTECQRSSNIFIQQSGM